MQLLSGILCDPLLEIVEFSLVYEISLITLICLNHMTFQDGRHMIPYFSRLSCISLFSFQGAISELNSEFSI